MELNLMTVTKSVHERTCIVWANLASAVSYPGKDTGCAIFQLC